MGSIFATFKDFQHVLAQKVAPGNGTAAGEGWNCPYPCDYHEPTCFDILPASPGQCYYNVLWAKSTGLTQHPEWYSQFPGLTVNSSVNDFQYVLHTKLKTGNGTGWQCPMPCTSNYLPSATSGAPRTSYTTTTTTSFTTTTTSTTAESGSSFPWWCWLLLVLLAGLCIVAAVATRSVLAPKKKKRAAEVASESDPESNSTPLTRTMSPEAQHLFDQIDTNHDGVITREEYARLNLFDQIDTNHDGVLSREEYARLNLQPVPVQLTSLPTAQPFQPALPAVRTVPAYPVRMAPARQNLFDQLDTNHDGVLTRDELAQLR